MKQIIIAKDITKAYGEGQEKRNVLDGVSITVGEGEFLAVMGPSGCGKSTLLFALSGMDGIDGGSVTFEGQELAGLKEKEFADLLRRKMGFVFQQPAMLKNLNLLDNIMLPALRDNGKNAAGIKEKARALMKKTGIEELEERGITQVSGGQLQRAGICRALMNDPVVIFGDEPTGALNSKSSQEIMDLFARINREGTAVLLVTHDAKVAAQTERVLFMRDGMIVREMRLSKEIGNDITGENIAERTRKITQTMAEIGG